MNQSMTKTQMQEEIDLIISLCNCHGQMINPEYLLNILCNGNQKLYLHSYSILTELANYDHITSTLWADSGKLAFRPNDKTKYYLDNLRLQIKLKRFETRFVNVQTWLIIITAIATVWGGYMSYRQTIIQEKQYLISPLKDKIESLPMPSQIPNPIPPCICPEDSLKD